MAQSATLTQVQIIQSLADALSWMEKELSWGVPIQELNHLTGRIGELYAAMITRGQMALSVNQAGYDVVAASNERVSVKTVTTSSSVQFSPSTFELADRIMILRIINDPDTGLSVEEVLDRAAADVKELLRRGDGKYTFSLASSSRSQRPIEQLRIVERATFRHLEIRKYESGAIRIAVDGTLQQGVVKDTLRILASELGVDVYNVSGAVKNTQQLGAEVIRALQARAVPS